MGGEPAVHADGSFCALTFRSLLPTRLSTRPSPGNPAETAPGPYYDIANDVEGVAPDGQIR